MFTQDYSLEYISGLIVSYPLLILLAFAIKRHLKQQPLSKQTRARKIFVYITLISTFMIIIGTITNMISLLLSGTVTYNAAYHFAVTVGISGVIFWYFLTDTHYETTI